MYNLLSRRRASKDYKRSLQRQVSNEVLKNAQKRELTQMINPIQAGGHNVPPTGFFLAVLKLIAVG